ncbi:MAG TPA: hypothetical protein RMH26_14465, partial [Polyangiaceae bacterium LLY-WYZ-15_(1-7)]|nr:hypothetical protein [Polyangiaceae bacterium LLY-WYZ-15_(1-7)]
HPRHAMTDRPSRRAVSRRAFLRRAAASSALAALPGGMLAALAGRPRAKAQPRPDARFLFVITASGGASILDGFLPVVETEVSSLERARRLLTYPEAAVAQPAGSQLRCVRNLGRPGPFRNGYDLEGFLRAHAEDTAVVTVENTSVNHVVAQKRAITGAGIHGGRTLMEAMAEVHGEGLLLPNCNMGAGGYLEPGDAADVPTAARAEIIANPMLFAVSTHGSRGVPRAPGADVIARARATRERLEGASPFAARFASSRLRERYLRLRRELAPDIEAADLIHSLLLVQESEDVPLGAFGLRESEDAAALRAVFPGLGVDTLQTQAALAFLLAKHGVATALTFGPGFAPNVLPSGLPDTPIAFDFSHSDHLTAQNVMWSRVMEAADGLIRLLKDAPFEEGTLWDRSLIYVATDFGRSKERPAESQSFGSGHHLNNGNVLISPLLRGNRVYGGVDPETCLTYGFDPATGEPDRDTVMREGHLYSLVCQAMGIDFRGRHDMRGLLR